VSEGAEDKIVMTSALQEDMVKTLTRRWASLFMKLEGEEVRRLKNLSSIKRHFNENYDRQKFWEIFRNFRPNGKIFQQFSPPSLEISKNSRFSH